MNSSRGYKQSDAGVIPEGWETVRLGDIATVRTGPFGSSLHERDYVNDGIPIITVEHLDEFGVSHVDLPMVSEADRKRLCDYSLEENDIVFSRVGSIDRNALIRSAEVGWLFSGRLLRLRIRTKKVLAPYLSFHFRDELFKKRLRSVAVGQTMPSLNTQILNGIAVAIPPLSEQRRIAAFLGDTVDLITALEMGQTRLQLRLKLTHAQRDSLVDDAKGDCLDAVLCLMQAAWAQHQHNQGAPLYGLPAGIDPLEGWIITA